MDDITLLREYATRHSEEAFELLVSRHVRLVYSAALRQTGDPSMAEEITQTVFVILAEKAERISNNTLLSGWLFNTTRYVALAHLRTEARRRQREQECPIMQSETQCETPPNPLWEEIAPILDEGLAQLGEQDRRAVLLRFFEDKNLAEVGRSLGIREDAARMRVNRAIEKLHSYLARRGITTTTALLAMVISAHSVQAAPVTLVKTITAAAIAKGAAGSGSSMVIAKGALKIMAWTKTKTVIVVSMCTLLISGTTMVYRQQRLHTPQQAERETTVSKMIIAKQFGLGMILFAGEHRNQFPTTFDQIGPYIENNPDRDALNQFEIVYSGALSNLLNPASSIIARQKEPFLTSGGKWAKVYVYADCHAEVRVMPDKNFDAYEHEHIISSVN